MKGVGVGAAVGCAGRDRVIDMRPAQRRSFFPARMLATAGRAWCLRPCSRLRRNSQRWRRKFGMVRQQWLVDDGNIDALPGDAAGLQRPHTEAGVSARFQ